MEFDYYDISPTVSPSSAVFPGDAKFKRKVSLDFKKGHHLELSSIETSLHIGAHADAPSHYHVQGDSIEKRSLHHYYGPAQVIHITKKPNTLIAPEDISHVPIRTPRVLFATKSFPNLNQWNNDFVALAPELIPYLAKLGVVTVGIDTPSVDPAESKDLQTHQLIYKHNLAILEGLVLQDVPDGVYHLVALPLKLKDAEASPVRAILVQGPTLANT